MMTWYDEWYAGWYITTTLYFNKLGLSCAKLSSSWLQAYSASNQKIIQGANPMS